MINDKVTTQEDRLRQISIQDLQSLGIQQVAYIRPVMLNGVQAFAIHAADGTPLAFHQDKELAKTITRQHDLEPVTLQ